MGGAGAIPPSLAGDSSPSYSSAPSDATIMNEPAGAPANRERISDETAPRSHHAPVPLDDAPVRRRGRAGPAAGRAPHGNRARAGARADLAGGPGADRRTLSFHPDRQPRRLVAEDGERQQGRSAADLPQPASQA